MRFVLILLLLLASCAPLALPPDPTERPSPAVEGSPTAPSPAGLPLTSSPSPAALTAAPPPATAAATLTPRSTPPGLLEEAILILEPGPGSVVVHPVRVAGVAGPAFEAGLTARILAENGTVLSVAPARLQPGEEGRLHFSAQLPALIEADAIQAVVQVYATSPRDGEITHLASAGVRLASSGGKQLRQIPSQLETIAIFQPVPGAELRGGEVQVLGIGLASFEQTLVAEVLDQDGQVIGSQPLIVNAPEPGKPGPFQVSVLYSAPVSGPGRVVVRDPNPDIAGDNHLASVEVLLNP